MIRESRNVRLRVFAASVALWAAMLGCAHASAEPGLRIGGTGSAMGTASALAEAYAASAHRPLPSVLGNLGTAGALKALEAGAIDLAIASRALEQAEATHFYALPFSRTPLVFAAHRNAGLRNVTLQQAMALYGGVQVSWPGGQRVRPILRPMSDSDTNSLRAISTDFDVAVLRAHAIKGLQTAVTDEESIEAIASTPGAFGTTTLAMLASGSRSVCVLALDGIAPTARALDEGRYKLHKSFYLVFRTPARPQVQRFVDFAFSERGKAIVLRYGQIPAAAPRAQ